MPVQKTLCSRGASAGRPERAAPYRLVLLACAFGLVNCQIASSTAAPEPKPLSTTIIHAGTLLAVPGEAPAVRQSVVIEGGKIVAVENGFVSRPGARIVDLSSSFVLPGLIDSHVHLQFGGGDYRGDLTRMADGYQILRGYAEAHRALEAGFTTIRDQAGSADVVFSIRDAISRGDVEGPRIFASGPALIPTGGGILKGLGVRSDVAGLLEPGSMEMACDGSEACRRAARRALADGADHIKIIVSGSILEPKLGRQMTRDEIEAIVAAAREMGKPVSAAALEPDGIKVAIEAGVRTIEHGTLMDESSFPLFRSSGVWFVPTMMSVEKLRARADSGDALNPVARANIIAASDNLLRIVPLAYRAGVPILFGTDQNVGSLGTNAREFVLMRAAGMREADIIRSATIDAARALGQEAALGAIRPGMVADIIAVQASPLNHIENLGQVRFVMKAGRPVILGSRF